MAVVDVAEVAPIDLGIEPETITAVTRISSYSRSAPLSEDYSVSLPYFLAVVGTRSGYLHVVSVQPPRSALSLRPKHQRSYRHVVANDGVKSHSQRLSSTPVKGLHASPLISSVFARRSSSALGGAAGGSDGGGSSPQMSRDTSTTTPLKQRVRMAPSVTPTRASPGGGPNASMASSTTATRLLADESIRKAIFSPASCRVFALSAGKVYCHFVNIPSRFELELVGAVTIPGSADHLQGCIDFAVTNTPACPAQLVVLTTSKIVICTFDGPVPFHMNAIKSANALGDTCAWVGSVIAVASVADREYRFYTANSSKPLDRISAGERWMGGGSGTNTAQSDDPTAAASKTRGGKATASKKAPTNHAVVLVPLQDEFDYSDREQRIVAVDRCAVVVSAKSKSTLFRQSVLVLRCDPAKGGIETIRRIPLLTTTPVKSLGMWGPWLVVAGSVGFETYSAISGDLIQSSLEEANVDCMSLATRASQLWNLERPDESIRATHTSRGYELVLATPRPGCNAAAPYVSMVCFHPPFDVVCELLRDASTPWADDNSLLAEVLLRFAHSVGAEMISPEMALGNVSFDRPDRNDKEALSDEYDKLRASFRHVGGEVPKPKADNCAGCGTTFRFFRRPTPCAACGEHICDKCTSTVRSVVYNGTTDPDSEFFTEQKAKICGSCLTHCAPDLYRLIDNRLYVQAINLLFQRHRAKRLENMRAGRGSRLTGADDDDDVDDDADDEMVAAATSDGDPTDIDGPEDVMVDESDATTGGNKKKHVSIGSAFSLRRAGQVVLQRCLDDGKFAACVMLLPMVIGRSARRWRDWVFRFSTAKAVAMLARFVPWRSLRRHVDPWLFTYLLTTLTKQDPIRLYTTVNEWPANLYDADEVAFYITQALERAVRQADEAFATCRPHYWPEEDAASRAGVGLIYRTARVESLVRSVCLVHDKRGQSRQSVAAYLDHWLAYTPMWDRPRSTAPPSVATAPFMDPWQRIADDDLMGMLQSTAAASASPRDRDHSHHHHGDGAATSSGPLSSATLQNQRSYLEVMIRVKGRHSGEYLASLPEVKSRPMLIRSLVEQLQALDADAKSRKASIVKRWGWSPGASAADGVDISGVLLDFLDRLSSGSKEDIRVTEPFHEIQAELYITHKPDKLLWFLRNEFVSSVNWSRVNQYVRERRMYRELAYVVSRSGDYPEAIRLIIRCLKSVKYAIEFVVDVNGGPELWDQVMYHCRQNKDLLDDFLEHASGHVNLSKFFDDEHMPKKNRVRLGDAQVTGMLTKEHVNAALTESGAESFKTDNLIATGKMLRKRRAAVKFGAESLSKCPICEGPIVAADVVAMGSGCGHMFHMRCIEDRFAARRRLQRRGGGNGNKATTSAGTSAAEAAQKEEDEKRKSWQYRYGSYEVHKEVGTRDLAELLPPEYHARVMAYLPQERRRVAGLASKAWSRASVDAVVFDREETDATNMLRGQPHEVRRMPTVAIGSKHWSKEVCCIVCHGDLA